MKIYHVKKYFLSPTLFHIHVSYVSMFHINLAEGKKKNFKMSGCFWRSFFKALNITINSFLSPFFHFHNISHHFPTSQMIFYICLELKTQLKISRDLYILVSAKVKNIQRVLLLVFLPLINLLLLVQGKVSKTLYRFPFAFKSAVWLLADNTYFANWVQKLSVQMMTNQTWISRGRF